MMAAAGQLGLRSLVKRFGEALAVDELDLEIGAGEFFSLLGASGCGKTTTLRMVAGFERPDSGRILLDGEDLTDVSPHRRPVNTVFQSYALFPFLDVRENVAFGLKYHHVTKQEQRRRVDRALALVQMDALAGRKPHQLSGGQQQRVALARALVLEPTVLLLDEPMGALDAKLRKQLQIELRSLQRTVGTTFVYVTHDQEEALTMSDRLAVLRDGRLMQVGTPSEVYSRPANAYVAGFLGTANLFDTVVTDVAGGLATCRVGEVDLLVPAAGATARGDTVSLVVRPERITLEPSAPAGVGTAGGVNRLPGRIERATFRGAQTQVTLALAGRTLVAEVANVHGEVPDWLSEGRQVWACIAPDAIRVLPSAAPSSPTSPSPSDPPVATDIVSETRPMGRA
ncbi:MAG TPA: ABC transporter ATP-binding protein [Nocardioidaceae bacterium]|nr:ABC transporter ATP-binding protein [Nocardioidaceae bacterium]